MRLLISSIFLIFITACASVKAPVGYGNDVDYVCTDFALNDVTAYRTFPPIYKVNIINLAKEGVAFDYRSQDVIDLLNYGWSDTPISFVLNDSITFVEPMIHTRFVDYNSMLEKYNDLDAINIVVVDTLVWFRQESTKNSIKGAAGWIPDLSDPYKHLTALFMRSDEIVDNILLHEMGHIMGLHHPWWVKIGTAPGNTCGTGDGIPGNANPPRDHKTVMPDCKYRPGALDTLSRSEIVKYMKNRMGYADKRCMEEFDEGQIQLMTKISETNYPLKLCRVNNKPNNIYKLY